MISRLFNYIIEFLFLDNRHKFPPCVGGGPLGGQINLFWGLSDRIGFISIKQFYQY